MNPAYFRPLLNALTPVAALVFVVVVFSLLPTVDGAPERVFFLTLDNFKFVAVQTVIVAIGALGMTLIVAGGGIDLSAGSTIALSGVVAACTLRGGHSPSMAVLASALTGALVGSANGALISFLRLTPFIVTLGMLAVVRGIAKWLASDVCVVIPASWIEGLMAFFPKENWMIVTPGVWIALLLAGLTALTIRNTIFGRHTLAIGSNEFAARLCGIRVPPAKMLIYTAGGFLFGLAGVLQMARLRHGDPATGAGLELDIIGAVLVGGASLGGGHGSVFGSMIGALTITVLRNGSQQGGWPVYTQAIIVGGVILIAVATERFRWGKIRIKHS